MQGARRWVGRTESWRCSREFEECPKPFALGLPGRADRPAPLGVQGAGASLRVSVCRRGSRNDACAVTPTADPYTPRPVCAGNRLPLRSGECAAEYPQRGRRAPFSGERGQGASAPRGLPRHVHALPGIRNAARREADRRAGEGARSRMGPATILRLRSVAAAPMKGILRLGAGLTRENRTWYSLPVASQ